MAESAVHVVRRQFGARIAGLADSAILDEAASAGASIRAPGDWRDQLTKLGPAPPLRSALAGHVGLGDAVRILALWRQLPRLPTLTPPTSSWGNHTAAFDNGALDTNERALSPIRVLLAKAESTEFGAEADAFTSKAQQLMTRHSIDQAMLDVSTGARAAD